MSAFWKNLVQILSKSFGNHPTPTPSPQPVPRPAPAPTPLPSPPTPSSGAVEAINQARAWSHLPPLTVDPALDRLAADWAQTMASGVGLTHGDFARRITAAFPNTSAGEDIAEGQPDAESVVAAWLASPPHRANILGAYNRVGIGSAKDNAGNLYWCADFVQVN